MWKRYSAEITHRWDLTGFDIQEEHPRPQYLARLSHVKRQEVNVVTNTMEPYVPFWYVKLPMTILSFSAVILLVRFRVFSEIFRNRRFSGGIGYCDCCGGGFVSGVDFGCVASLWRQCR